METSQIVEITGFKMKIEIQRGIMDREIYRRWRGSDSLLRHLLPVGFSKTRISTMLTSNFRRVFWGLAVLLAGCTRYHPMPLMPAAVQNGLTAPSGDELRVKAESIKHPLLRPIDIDGRDGLTPDQAAVIAVVANPSLRSARDRRGLVAAQLLQAGILPNPQVNFGENYPYGGAIAGAVTASQVGLSWDVAELISRDAKIRAAQAGAASVDLDVAWQEWQTAQAARTAVYDLASLKAQQELTNQIARQMSESLSIIRAAVDRHDKTLLDLTAAEAASLDASAAAMAERREVSSARLALNKALGFAPDAEVKLAAGIALAHETIVPPPQEILAGLEDRRLDLAALRLGYQSQEQTLRAAVLEQFPKINIGFNRQRDDTNVQSLGFAVTVDLPIFDRNQAAIATEMATRQKLYDEYIERVYEARFDVFAAVEDLAAISTQIRQEENSLPGLQRLANTYRAGFDEGNVDVLSYYSALNGLAQKQLDILKLKQQLMDTMVALGLAAGEYIPG
jgi:outer membrane protein, heavy metal efflux system